MGYLKLIERYAAELNFLKNVIQIKKELSKMTENDRNKTD